MATTKAGGSGKEKAGAGDGASGASAGKGRSAAAKSRGAGSSSTASETSSASTGTGSGTSARKGGAAKKSGGSTARKSSGSDGAATKSASKGTSARKSSGSGTTAEGSSSARRSGGAAAKKSGGGSGAAKKSGGRSAAKSRESGGTETVVEFRGEPLEGGEQEGGMSRAAKVAGVGVLAGALVGAAADAVKKAAGGGKKTTRTRGGVTADGGSTGLLAQLRRFVTERLAGWNHHDWLGLLDDLRGQGHDVSDESAVGASLERERLVVVLTGVEGLGPKRVQALADRFGTLYSLRNAHLDEVALAGNLPRPLAERVAARVAERTR